MRSGAVLSTRANIIRIMKKMKIHEGLFAKLMTSLLFLFLFLLRAQVTSGDCIHESIE